MLATADVHNMTEKINNTIAFISGDILTTIVFFWTALKDIDYIHPIAKIILALIVGIVGGAGGLIGKDIYQWLKKRLKSS